MKRTYTISLLVRGTFERKVKAKREAERLLKSLRVSEPWVKTGTRVVSRAKPERTSPEPDPAMVEEKIAKGQALAELREIAADMAAILSNVKKPRVEWSPNRWCDGGDRAHVHIQKGVHWIRGPRNGRKIPYGMICINPSYVLGNPKSKYVYRRVPRSPRERWPWLIAHELMHLRLPGGSHKRAKFNPAVDDLLVKYGAFKVGAWTPPRRVPTWAAAKETTQ